MPKMLKLSILNGFLLLLIPIVSFVLVSAELSSILAHHNQHYYHHPSSPTPSCIQDTSVTSTTTTPRPSHCRPPPPTTPPPNSADNSHCHLSKPNDNNQPIANAFTTYDFDCDLLNFCDDRLGFEAILFLHRQLDEDANGDIDISESDEFIRDELKYVNGATERQKAFHGNDKHISVDELWRAWRVSTVHNWTVDETVEWLTEVVELPKYQDTFRIHSINGISLPRLAANPQLFITLGINNPIHRQKIALKAMDVVLFGVPKQKSSNKDLIMGFLFVFATVVAWYAYYQHKYSKEHVRKMMKEIEALANAEKQLESLQMELDKTKQEQEEASKEKRDLERKLKENEQQLSSDGASFLDGVKDGDSRIKELEKELNITKNELKRFEQAQQWTPPIALQPYLQLTYEIETRYFNAKKTAAEMQLKAARDGCDKLKRKRSTLLGAFRMAHSSSIDYVDNTIIQARTLLAELTQEMQERIKRWKQIESFCGFEIIHNHGLQYLEQHLYGGSVIPPPPNPSTLGTSPSSTSLSKMFRRGSETTLADEDSLSLTSAPSSYQYNSMWSNQVPANLQMKRISSSTLYAYSPHQSQSHSELLESPGSGFYIGDDHQPINGKIGNNIKKKLVNNYKASRFAERRGSSDGVERHFEELNNQQLHQQQPLSSGLKTNSNNNNSQSESNIFDNTLICNAYFKSKSKSNPTWDSNSNDSSKYNHNEQNSLAESGNEETLSSSSSNGSTLTLNQSTTTISSSLSNQNEDLRDKRDKMMTSKKSRGGLFRIGKRNKTNKQPLDNE